MTRAWRADSSGKGLGKALWWDIAVVVVVVGKVRGDGECKLRRMTELRIYAKYAGDRFTWRSEEFQCGMERIK